jgi:hypothetical protein
VAEIRHYTGLSLCQGADVRDLTTREEKETTPGYSYHVALTLDAGCEASFRKQLAELPGNNCNATGDLSRGCAVEDAYPKAQKHTSITLRSLRPGQYDMSFWS